MAHSLFFRLMFFPLVLSSVSAVPELESFGARPDMVSISGVSSGAYMAGQMHVAYSSSIMGAGIVAGGPYFCAQGTTFKALGECMATGDINVRYLATTATDYAYFTRTIDSTSNLAGSKVYIFGGSADTSVVQDVVRAAEEYYTYFMAPTNIMTVYDIPAEHSMVTDKEGNSCGYSGKPYINNCGYNAAYELLNHIYGGLQRPTTETEQKGDFLTFDQTEYFNFGNAAAESVADSGYVYVPSGCRSSASHCKVHLSLHGCLQSSETLGDLYARTTGYNEVGELNDIIIIHPQTISKILNNPNGCWDWWGYNTMSYACNLAPQMKFLKGVIDRATA